MTEIAKHQQLASAFTGVGLIDFQWFGIAFIWTNAGTKYWALARLVATTRYKFIPVDKILSLRNILF
jgi:hypothetical protein